MLLDSPYTDRFNVFRTVQKHLDCGAPADKHPEMSLRILLVTLLLTVPAGVPVRSEPSEGRAFALGDVDYFHRWSQNDQHEFTPQGQDDLEKWTDMVTINIYRDAHNGDALAAKANSVLANYEEAQAKVLKTDSRPRTADRPAEHLIVAVFARPTFVEVAFARLELSEGVGCSVVYSHRIYGEKIGDEMSAWLKEKGAETEKTLMQWAPFPSSIVKEARRTDR
jgi:hypothetical protein